MPVRVAEPVPEAAETHAEASAPAEVPAPEDGADEVAAFAAPVQVAAEMSGAVAEPEAVVNEVPVAAPAPMAAIADAIAASEIDAPRATAGDATISHADMAAANLFAAEIDEPDDDLSVFESPAFSADEIYELSVDAVAEVVIAPERAAPVEVAAPPVFEAVASDVPVTARAPEPVAAPVVTEVAPAPSAPPAPVAPVMAAPIVSPAPVVEPEPEPAVAVMPSAPIAPPTPRAADVPAPAPPSAPAPPPVAPPPAPRAAPVMAVPPPVTAAPPMPVPAVAAAPAYEVPPPARYDTPQMPAAWSTPAAPRFDSHPHESSRYGAPDPQPVLPELASELAAIERESTAPDSLPAVVLSLTRDGARGSGGGARGSVRTGGIERLLRLAAARGASALYLTTQARPAVRVDGDIRLLDGEAALSSGDVEAAVLELAPEGARDKESAEWIRDLADVGRVRITTFRDYRGPGALLRMIQARATSAEQLGLVREIQALATEPEGLVIVTGPRASGKSTLVSAFVDLINRQRNDYVITLEGQIRLVHESRGSLISQRELRGSAAEVVTAARAALRENPDVLVIEDLRSPDVLQVALDAAGSGLLVFASVTAASATAALERLVDLCPSDERRNVRAALAEHLRGVVAQVLLRKAGGGRLAARELVLNTNAVAALVSDGQIAQLPRAIDSGRKLGMAPLNDALVAFVQSGAVDVREAYRKADDKAGLLALLRREGIDTSFVERLA